MSTQKPLRKGYVFYHPRRRILRIGRSGMRVLLSPEDRDLARQHWQQHHAKGYAYQRHWIVRDGVKCRQITWLHHVIADRMVRAAGLTSRPPGLVRFRNGARLDCRRENIVWTKEPLCDHVDQRRSYRPS